MCSKLVPESEFHIEAVWIQEEYGLRWSVRCRWDGYVAWTPKTCTSILTRDPISLLNKWDFIHQSQESLYSVASIWVEATTAFISLKLWFFYFLETGLVMQRRME